MRELTDLRSTSAEYHGVHLQVLQTTIRRLQRSFENMWAGKLARKYLQLSKIGQIKLRLSRAISDNGIIKTLSIKRTVNGWFACFAVEVPTQPLGKTENCMGIDLGIENLAAFSDGTFIENKRFYEQHQKELRRAQRSVARRKNFSNRRANAVILLRKLHAHISHCRADYLHKIPTKLVQTYGTIVLENLNVQGPAQGVLSKQVHDAGWSQFVALLKCKAENAGSRVIEVDPRYTSQVCPVHQKKKSSAGPVHKRGECGYTRHRDTAAAENITRMEPLDAKTGEANPCLV